jgi:hypothetical protein
MCHWWWSDRSQGEATAPDLEECINRGIGAQVRQQPADNTRVHAPQRLELPDDERWEVWILGQFPAAKRVR